MNSASADLANLKWKIFENKRKKEKEKNPGSSKEQNFNLPCAGNYLYSIYILFTIIYIAFTLYLVLYK